MTSFAHNSLRARLRAVWLKKIAFELYNIKKNENQTFV